MIEVEMKFKLEKDISNSLEELGFHFVREEENVDIYYNHPCKDHKETDEALRIRSVGESVELTYKGPKLDNRSKSREELNVMLDDLDSMDVVLQRLGFSKSGEVKKRRKIYGLRELTVCLDDVKGLGKYVELEMIAFDNSELNKLEELAQKLGFDIKDQILTSYLNLLESSAS